VSVAKSGSRNSRLKIIRTIAYIVCSVSVFDILDYSICSSGSSFTGSALAFIIDTSAIDFEFS